MTKHSLLMQYATHEQKCASVKLSNHDEVDVNRQKLGWDGRTDRQTGGRTDRQTDKRAGRQAALSLKTVPSRDGGARQRISKVKNDS